MTNMQAAIERLVAINKQNKRDPVGTQRPKVKTRLGSMHATYVSRLRPRDRCRAGPFLG